jgi:hypothetical protein
MASEYVHGTMATAGHHKTFSGFVKTSAFLTAFFVVTLLMPILVFAAHISWFPALVATFVVGLILAPIFKLGGGWYGTLFGLAVLTFILGVSISALS